MPQTHALRLTLLGAIAATLAIGATAPPNSQPNPYLAPSRTGRSSPRALMGSCRARWEWTVRATSGSPSAAYCATHVGSHVDPVLQSTSISRKLLNRLLARTLFAFLYGLPDRQGSADWGRDQKVGHQVFKFSPDGKVLMTLGKAGSSQTALTPSISPMPWPSLLRLGRPQRRARQRTRSEIHEGWEVYLLKDGVDTVGPGQFEDAHARAFDSKVRRCRPPWQQPHPDFRPGRKIPRVGRVHFHRCARRDVRGRFGIHGQGRIRAQPGLEEGHPDRHEKMAQSRLSFRTHRQAQARRVRRKVYAPMATSTARKSKFEDIKKYVPNRN